MNVIFCHLNADLPRYLRANIETTATRFPADNIYVITDRPTKAFQSRNVILFRFKGDSRALAIHTNLAHPANFRNSFWTSSISRFVALSEFAREIEGPHLHVESDVALFKGFPMAKFEAIPEVLAYPVVAKNRGVASSLYFKNFEAINDLSNYAVEETTRDPMTTDMVILANYYLSHTDIVRPLPFGPANPELYSLETSTELLKKWETSIEYFGGVFDGNDIGTFLFGTDPRNRRGKSLTRSAIPHNFASIGKWLFAFDFTNQNLQVIDSKNQKSLSIYSVHITNKRLPFFKSYSQLFASRIRVRNIRETSSSRIYLTVFASMATSYLFRKLRFK